MNVGAVGVDDEGSISATTCPTEGPKHPAKVLARVECEEEAPVGCAPFEDTPFQDTIGAMERVFTTLAFAFLIRFFAFLFALIEDEILATMILGSCFKVKCLKYLFYRYYDLN